MSEPNEMIERVARAMQAEADKWPQNSLDRRFVYSHRQELARAAIEAIREPTEKMVLVTPLMHCDDPAQIWRDMVGAALGEPPPDG